MTTICNNNQRITETLQRMNNSVPNNPELVAKLTYLVRDEKLKFQTDEVSETASGIGTGIGSRIGDSYTNLSDTLGLTTTSLIVQLAIEGLAEDAAEITEYPNGLKISWEPVSASEACIALEQKIAGIKRITNRITGA